MKRWTIPRIWKNRTVFILGGGPSLLDVDLTTLIGQRVIAINNAYGERHRSSGIKDQAIYGPYDWIDVCWFVDERWFRWHKKNLKKFPGIIATTVRHMHGKNGVFSVKRGKAYGIETNPEYVANNKSAGGSSINLAYHLGASRIILLGFDMRRVNNVANWHSDHPAPDKNPYEKFLRPFKHIATESQELGLEIVNATPGSAIKHFPMMTPKEAIREYSQ